MSGAIHQWTARQTRQAIRGKADVGDGGGPGAAGAHRPARRARRARRRARRVPARRSGAGAGAGGGARRRARDRRRSAAVRRARRGEGQHLHARRADHRRLADPRALRPALHRDRRRAARSGRRDRPRQDQLRRVRDGLVDRELGVRRDAQPVGARSHPGRIERRLRGRGGGRPGAGLARLGHRRLDPPAGARCAASSASSRPTAASRATACSPSARRSIRSARSRGPCRTPPTSSRRWPATTPPTPRRRTPPCPTSACALDGGATSSTPLAGRRIGVPARAARRRASMPRCRRRSTTR